MAISPSRSFSRSLRSASALSSGRLLIAFRSRAYISVPSFIFPDGFLEPASSHLKASARCSFRDAARCAFLISVPGVLGQEGDQHAGTNKKNWGFFMKVIFRWPIKKKCNNWRESYFFSPLKKWLSLELFFVDQYKKNAATTRPRCVRAVNSPHNRSSISPACRATFIEKHCWIGFSEEDIFKAKCLNKISNIYHNKLH